MPGLVSEALDARTIEEVCTSPVSLLDSVLMTPSFAAYLFGYLHIIECIIFKATTLHISSPPDRTSALEPGGQREP